MKRQRGTGYLTPRGQGYRVQLTVAGRVFSFTVPTPDRAEADRWARNKYAELEAQYRRRGTIDAGPRFSQLIARFQADELPTKSAGTRRAYRDSLTPIRRYFIEENGDPALDRVGAGEVRAFLAWRRSHCARVRAAAPRTLAKDRALLHRLFEFAEQLEWREGNPVARVDVPKGDPYSYVILDAAQYAALLAACRDPLTRLYVLLLGETGLRCESEALWLRWEDVDLEAGFLRVETGRDGHRTKGGKGRWVPLTAPLRDALRDHFARYRFARYDGHPTPWVFHHDMHRRHHKPGERIHSMREGVLRAARAAKLPAGWRLHDLRHRRVTTWLAEGKSPVLVREALGHADLRTTMAYTHLNRDPLSALVEDRNELAAGLVRPA